MLGATRGCCSDAADVGNRYVMTQGFSIDCDYGSHGLPITVDLRFTLTDYAKVNLLIPDVLDEV